MALLTMGGAVGCGGSATDGSTGTVTTTTEPTTTTTQPKPVSDQSQPKSTFGLAFDHDERKLWVTDFYGAQIIAIDPDTGSIIKRYGGIDGIPEGVDDVAVGGDGSLYYTGFNDGQVGRMSPTNVSVVIDGLGVPGVGSIAFNSEGKLFVGRSIIGDGLWEIDPKGESKYHRPVTDKMGEGASTVNSFDIGFDGTFYGPRFGLQGKGALVAIDPTTGKSSEVVSGFDAPIAVKLSKDGDTAFVLSLAPGSKPKVSAVDLDTKAVREVATLDTALAENLAVAHDGRIFVSSFNEPVLTVINPDGTTKKLVIGKPEPVTTTESTEQPAAS